MLVGFVSVITKQRIGSLLFSRICSILIYFPGLSHNSFTSVNVQWTVIHCITRMHSSRMRTARSLTISCRILCMLPPGKTTHTPLEKPHMPPGKNHACPPPRKNHACPPRKNHAHPPGKTMHAPQEKPHMPPSKNHACPPP